MLIEEVKRLKEAAARTPASTCITPMVQKHNEMCTLTAVNPRKATGPEGVTGRVLKECANQVAGIH